jgi:hypothetical protein
MLIYSLRRQGARQRLALVRRFEQPSDGFSDAPTLLRAEDSEYQEGHDAPFSKGQSKHVFKQLDIRR